MPSQLFDTAGSHSFDRSAQGLPVGHDIVVHVWSGGGGGRGGGANPSGGGGGGGGYATSTLQTVEGNDSVTVGVGGTAGTAGSGNGGDGGESWFRSATTVRASGGGGSTGTAGGAAGTGTHGTTLRNGGTGGTGASHASQTRGGGGGGGGAGTSGNGGNGGNNSAATGGGGGSAGSGDPAGGVGGAGGDSPAGAGVAGSQPGGGGGGGSNRDNSAGAAGAAGMVLVVWEDPVLEFSATAADANPMQADAAVAEFGTGEITGTGALTLPAFAVAGRAHRRQYDDFDSGVINPAYWQTVLRQTAGLETEGSGALTLPGLSIASTGAAGPPTFSELLNPTGDPIGGGPGYSDIIDPLTADFVVETKAELLSALAAAESGDIIYVDDDATIDLTGEVTTEQNGGLAIPAGVTLASGRGRALGGGAFSLGGLIVSDDAYTPESLFVALFKTGGDDVRITGLRSRGPNQFGGDHAFTLIGVANFLRSYHHRLEIDNCELYAWDKWVLYAFIARDAHFHHNHVHHTSREGYGYGVWHGGSSGSPQFGESMLIEANYFDVCRHHLASSGHRISWEARHNIFGRHTRSERVDRHEGSLGEGGIDTNLHHNLLFAFPTTQAVWLITPPRSASNGGPGQLEIHDNWWESTLQYGGRYRSNVYTLPDRLGDDVFITDNQGIEDAVLPTAVLDADVTSGAAPLTVDFDASGSSDPDGHTIVDYHWHFGAGPDHYGDGLTRRGPTQQYTFTDPGVYVVEVEAINSFGVRGWTTRTITALPATGGYWLSAWVRNSYQGALTGFYQMAVRVNDTEVWTEDIAVGGGFWRHVMIDITSLVGTQGQTAKIAFRLKCIGNVTSPSTTVIYSRMYIDDVHILGGTVIANNDMELGTSWSTTSPTNWSFISRNTADARSKRSSYRISSGNSPGASRNAGEYGEIFQNVTLGAAL